MDYKIVQNILIYTKEIAMILQVVKRKATFEFTI